MPISETRRDEEGILYADIDVAQCVEPKQFHDVAGGYNRFDVFNFSVDRTHRDPVTFVDMPDPQALENDTRRQEMQDEITSQRNKPFRQKGA